ncbi:MAG: OmpH family outer membrane protein [Verrucomicrobiota bacterium]
MDFQICAVIRWLGVLILVGVVSSFGEEEGASKAGMKVATVDVQKLFRGYHKTRQAQREINDERARIQKMHHEETENLRGTSKLWKGLRKQIQERAFVGEELAQKKRELIVVGRELQMKERERDRQRAQAHSILNEQTKRRMKGLLEDIVSLSIRISKERGYDMLIDSSGKNSSQAPSIPYAKGAVDLTGEIEKELGKSAQGER